MEELPGWVYLGVNGDRGGGNEGGKKYGDRDGKKRVS